MAPAMARSRAREWLIKAAAIGIVLLFLLSGASYIFQNL